MVDREDLSSVLLALLARLWRHWCQATHSISLAESPIWVAIPMSTVSKQEKMDINLKQSTECGNCD